MGFSPLWGEKVQEKVVDCNICKLMTSKSTLHKDLCKMEPQMTLPENMSL